jgi:integrase/recombinase XerD
MIQSATRRDPEPVLRNVALGTGFAGRKIVKPRIITVMHAWSPRMDSTPALGRSLHSSDLVPTAHGQLTPITEPVQNALDLVARFLLRYGNANTRAAYQRDIEHFDSWLNGRCDLLQVTPHVINLYVRTQEADEAKPATMARRLSALSKLYVLAVAEGLIGCNPVNPALVRRPKVPKTSATFGPDLDYAGRLVAAAEEGTREDRALVLLLITTGARVSEVLSATVADVGEERGHRVLWVNRKGGNKQRLALPPITAQALAEHLDDRTDGPLFAMPGDSAMTRHAARRAVKRVARAAGLEDEQLTSHSLRHACATLALESGAELTRVQSLLGHADPRTTARYLHDRNALGSSPSYALAGMLAGG